MPKREVTFNCMFPRASARPRTSAKGCGGVGRDGGGGRHVRLAVVWCRGLLRVGMTRRRALRGPGAPAGGRGRTETPPAKLSACARMPCPWRITRAYPVVRGMASCEFARRITYGHYARVVHTATGHAHYAPNIRTAHYPGGAMGTSRPTAITPGHATRKIRGTITHAKFARAPWRAHRASPVVRSRCVRTARVPWCGPVACAPRVSRGAVPLR